MQEIWLTDTNSANYILYGYEVKKKGKQREAQWARAENSYSPYHSP